jgi:EF hand
MKFRKSIIAAAILSLLAPSATVLVKSANAGVYAKEDKKKPNRNRQENRRNHRGGQSGEDDENENIDMRFAGMDRNGDGRITRDEWRGNDVSFNQHDWNGDGVLSGDEVRPGAQPNRREAEARARFDRLDTNDDNAISLSEWTGTQSAFERLDRNDDGVLSFDEFNARR